MPGVLIDGLSVVCDSGPVWPLAPTCSAATAAALHASGYAASEIDFAEFHYGSYCPPGAPCASSVPNSGYVVIHAKKPTPVLIALTADGSGKVTVAGALR